MPIKLKPALEFLLSNKKDGLNIRQLSLLMECKRGPQTVRGVAAKLGISKPAVTRAADALEAEGYLERKPDKKDARSVLLDLTPDGKTFAGNFA